MMDVGQLNPLENHTILKIVFDNLTFHDLKNVRLVSRLWKSESLKKWRSEAILVVKNGRECEAEAVSSSEAKVGIQLETLLNIFQEEVAYQDEEPVLTKRLLLLKNPFIGYSLNQWEFGKNRANERAFVEYFGKHIHHLVLDTCSDCQFAKDLLISDTPNLHSLTVANCLWNLNDPSTIRNVPRVVVPQGNLQVLKLLKTNRGCNHWFTSFHLQDFLRHYPNLETVVIIAEGGRGYACGTLTNLLENLRQLQIESKAKPTIKHLDLAKMRERWEWSEFKYPPFTRRHLELIEQCQLPLETLRVNLGRGYDVSLARLMEKYSHSIKSLWAHRCDYEPAFPSIQLSPTPHFEQLKELRLYGPFSENLNFLQSLKSLQCLHIYIKSLHEELIDSGSDEKGGRGGGYTTNNNKDKYYNVKATLDDCFVLPRLEEICGDFVVTDKESFKRLTKWIPNVRKANLLFLTKEILQVGLSAWKPTLRDLHLQPGSHASCVQMVKQLGFHMHNVI